MRRDRFLAGIGSAGAAAYVFGSRAFALDAPPALVRVRIFAAEVLDSVDVSGVHLDPASPPTMISAQSAPLTVAATLSDGSTVTRRYLGSIVSGTIDGGLALINTVGLESYVASVLASEISPGWHAETLKAQAVAVRTYALRLMRHTRPATYDLVDDTSNQVYRGIDRVVQSLSDAATATAGQTLTFGGAPADVWYHSSCGGHTAASVEISGVAAPPYLDGSPDTDADGHAYCSISPYFAWRNTLASADVASAAGIESSAVTAAAVADRWPDGRARTVRVDSDGATHDIDGHAFYSRAGERLGYKVVPSALFDIAQDGRGGFVFSGHGVGHGVGMCQWGAEGRARAGADAAAILAAYFPATVLTAVTL